MELVLAKNLRNKTDLYNIANDKPGWYRWWASKSTLDILLDSKYISHGYLLELLPHLTVKNIAGEKYYYIYVGVAIKESIQNRLDWHINQHHTKSSVESGFLSTLRQTISSLVAADQYDEASTNTLIDSLIVEYCEVDIPIKSPQAKEELLAIEMTEMGEHVLPLNIKGNKNPILKEFLKEIKEIRKNSKKGVKV